MPRPPAKREPILTRNGNVAWYYLHCQRCGAAKGRTNRKLCMRCRRSEPRKVAVRLSCPCGCGYELDRDDVIRGLYFGGLPSTLVGQVFRLSANQVLNIVAKRPRRP